MKKRELSNLDLNLCSVDKTLQNLWEWYSFTLLKNVSPLTMEKDFFKKWDIVIINEIIVKEHHDSIKVEFSIIRDWKTATWFKMSWGIFLSYFLTSLEKENVILSETINKNKDKIVEIIEDKKDKKKIVKKEKKISKLLEFFGKKNKKS